MHRVPACCLDGTAHSTYIRTAQKQGEQLLVASIGIHVHECCQKHHGNTLLGCTCGNKAVHSNTLCLMTHQ
jgi:hypothetical protein